jgi:hypothetical protein
MRKSDLVDGQEYAIWRGYGSYGSGGYRSRNDVYHMAKFKVTDTGGKRAVAIGKYSKATSYRPVIIGELTEYHETGEQRNHIASTFFPDARNFVMLWEEWEARSGELKQEAIAERDEKAKNKARELGIWNILNSLGMYEDSDDHEHTISVRLNSSYGDYIRFDDDDVDPELGNIPKLLSLLEELIERRRRG